MDRKLMQHAFLGMFLTFAWGTAQAGEKAAQESKVSGVTSSGNWERATIDTSAVGGCYLLRGQRVIRAIKNPADWNTECPAVLGGSIDEPTVCRQLNMFKPGDTAKVSTMPTGMKALSVDSSSVQFNDLVLSADPDGRWLRAGRDNIMYYVFLVNDPVPSDKGKLYKLYRVEAFDITDGACVDTELPPYRIEPTSCNVVPPAARGDLTLQGDVGEGYEPRKPPQRPQGAVGCPTDPWVP